MNCVTKNNTINRETGSKVLNGKFKKDHNLINSIQIELKKIPNKEFCRERSKSLKRIGQMNTISSRHH